jgi:hypothetical protein
MSHYNTVIQTAKDLKSNFKDISTADALSIAAKIEQTELLAKILKEGLLVNSSDNPVALEAIAMQLGFKGKKPTTDVTEALMSIWEAIENKK